MDKQVKNRWLKISAKSLQWNISEKLERDKSYPIALWIDIVDIQSPTNHDGTMDIKYVGASTGELKIHTDDKRDAVFLKKTKGSQSELLHNQIYHLGLDYESTMTKIRHLFEPYILDILEKYDRGEIE